MERQTTMQRRTFFSHLALASAAAAQGNAPSSSRSGGKRILAWAHADKDFGGARDPMRRRLGQARQAGIEVLLPFVHSTPQEDQAWYNSGLRGFVSKDLLSRLSELGREAGIEVHPILGGTVDVGQDAAARRRSSYLSGKPGGSRQDGRFCASDASSRTGPLRIAADILDHHDVAGLHLDYMRYLDTGNGLKWPCRCAACRQRYRVIFGKEEITAADLETPGAVYKYLQFRNGNIAGVVEQIHAIARQRGVKLSLAARANYFGEALVEGQDWADWARRGWLDFICPMNYTTKREEHRRLLATQLSLVGRACPVYSGVGRKWSAGELTSAEIVLQAEDALSLGADGIAIFQFSALSEEDFTALRSFSRSAGG